MSSNAEAIAIGAKYTFGDYTIGVGHEQLKGFIVAAGAGASRAHAGVPLGALRARSGGILLRHCCV
jgi:hypothetical protein